LDYVNDAQLAINAEAEILRATVSGAIVAGTANLVPAIADFLSAVALRIDTATDAKSLDYISEAELDARYPYRNGPNNLGTPVGYYVQGGTNPTLVLHPTPSVASTYTLTYNKIPAQVAVVGDVPELPLAIHPLIVRMIVALIKETDEDYEASQVIKSEVFAELATLRSKLNSPPNSYAVIRDDDPWNEFV
jgi:hypothetical protein